MRINLNSNYLEQAMRITLLVLLSLVLGTIIYSESCHKEVKVLIKVKENTNPIEAIPELNNIFRSKIEKIEKLDQQNSCYVITFKSREKEGLLNMIRKKEWVEFARFK